MTKYQELYELHLQLKTAQMKLNKAKARVKSLERQISELTEPNKWDVT